MTSNSRWIAGIAIGVAVAIDATAALAGVATDGVLPRLPAPGILGLVAAGVVGAIAVTRFRR